MTDDKKPEPNPLSDWAKDAAKRKAKQEEERRKANEKIKRQVTKGK